MKAPHNAHQKIPVFVINLDRRPDRFDFMAAQLNELGISWTRISALDAQTAQDDDIAPEIDMGRPLIRMGRGSQCCAVTTFDILRHITSENLPAALILQDDVELSPQIAQFLQDTNWITKGLGIIQFEKYGGSNAKRLCGPGFDTPAPGRLLHRLHSRTAGAGCFMVTQDAAKKILETKPRLRTPIDHYLFSPNVPNRFDQIGVGLVLPALAIQKMEDIASDLSSERKRPKTMREKATRFWLEINRLPHQIWAMFRGARWLPFEFKA